MNRYLAGGAAAAAIAGGALRAGSLSRSGALAALAVGTLTFGAGGPRAALVLLSFFVSSSALSRLGRRRKHALGADVAKGGARDGAQVLANGGAATLALLAWGRSPAGFAAFAGGYAAANADTWGTELGMLSGAVPRSILTGRPLAPGLSGGVTAAGNLAELGGAALVAVALAPDARGAVATFVGGVAGSVLDSLLGATLQERRWCPACARECENDPHACGTPTAYVRGLRGFSNDGVNAAATVAGVLIAGTLARRRR